MVILMLWNLRVIQFIAELKFFKLILLTVTRLTRPFFGRLLSLYLLFMVYIELGQIFFGGIITKEAA